MHCAVHEIMGSLNLTGGKKGVNLAKKGVKIEFSYIYYLLLLLFLATYLNHV
jgi:hypothetical protein